MIGQSPFRAYDQTRFPLATVLLRAFASREAHRIRLLALATREARLRGHDL